MEWWESISEDMLRQHFRAIGHIGLNPKTNGYTRPSYSPLESDALNYFREYARCLGLEAFPDEMCNLIIIKRGKTSARKIIIGSHCDSVANGGNYDGTAGVAAGISILEAIQDAGVTPELDIQVMGLRAEESQWFGTTYIGSRGALGLLTPEDLEKRRKDSGTTLKEYLLNMGVDTDALRRGVPTIPKENVECYIEAHIEQHTALLEKGVPVGIVTAIRGNKRHREIEFRGEYAHSGATPMDKRQDAVLAFAETAEKMDVQCRKYNEQELDLVFAFGEAHTDSNLHGITKVPGYFRAVLDIRSTHRQTLNDFYEFFRNVAGVACRRRNVELNLEGFFESQPAVMDEKIVSSLARAAGEIGVPYHYMISGAGHDAAVFANAGIPSTMVFFRHNGISHSPKEEFEYESGVLGTKAIAKLIDSYC
ncbi:Zn-dependent hydrolase [Candidatus Woesearchaeota archaeon]|nr:Zn-dependent hydrolase [Candidatus Woesearchaeota archaeon]